MPATDELPLRYLPGTMASLANAAAEAGARLVRASTGWLTGQTGAFRDLVLLRMVRFGWRFAVIRREQGELFFFWQRRSVERTVARGVISVRLEISEPGAARAPAASGVVAYRIVRPRMIVHAPRPADLPPSVPLDIDRKTIVVLRVGADGESRLFVEYRERRPTRVAYRHAGAWRMIASPDRPAGGWELAPFLALLQALHAWVRRDVELGDVEALRLPEPGRESSQVWLLLRQIGDGYAEARRGLAQLPPEPTLAALLPAYDITEYQAELTLAIDEGGQLAMRAEEAFKLALRARVVQEDGMARLRIAAAPPDFLISGRLHETFVAAIRRHQPASEGDAGALGFPTIEAFRSFVDRTAEQAIVFRTAREGDIDTDVAVFRSAGRVLVFEVVALVLPAAEPPRVEIRTLALLHYGSAEEGTVPDGDLVRYLFDLILSLKTWSEVLS